MSRRNLFIFISILHLLFAILLSQDVSGADSIAAVESELNGNTENLLNNDPALDKEVEAVKVLGAPTSTSLTVDTPMHVSVHEDRGVVSTGVDVTESIRGQSPRALFFGHKKFGNKGYGHSYGDGYGYGGFGGFGHGYGYGAGSSHGFGGCYGYYGGFC